MAAFSFLGAGLIFGIAFSILPVSGFSTWKHFVMPVAAMVLGGVSSNIRLTRSEVLGVIREKYVTTAYAKGLDNRPVMYRHVLRNALILVVVSTFMSLPWIVAGAVVMEKVFAMPGMGAWMVDAVVATDFPVVQACLLVISIAAPRRSAEQERTVRTVLRTGVPTLRTAAKSCVPTNDEAASAMAAVSSACGQKQARSNQKGSGKRLL